MFSQERHRAVLALLATHQKLSVQDLERALHASPATVRRDLRELERRGDVIRVHGGVIHPSFLDGEPTWDQRRRDAVSAKAAIAARAAELVRPGQTVFIDAGTTCLDVARRLLHRNDVMLFTISVPVLEAARAARARVIGIGGEYRRVTRALVGGMALNWLRNLHFDVGFIGGAGLSEKDGVSTTELREAAIKQEVIKRAAAAVLVADGSKWERPVAIRYAAWTDFKTWVTDTQTPNAAVRAIAGRGVKVMVATEKDAP
jgi:DeoR/GlpR family transcriptional regulator of sugar metabolism